MEWLGWGRSVVVCALGLVGCSWSPSLEARLGRSLCLQVWNGWVGVGQWWFVLWGWWVVVGRSWFVREGLGLVGWGWSVVVCAFGFGGLAGWGWSVLARAVWFGASMAQLGGYVAPA